MTLSKKKRSLLHYQLDGKKLLWTVYCLTFLLILNIGFYFFPWEQKLVLKNKNIRHEGGYAYWISIDNLAKGSLADYFFSFKSDSNSLPAISTLKFFEDGIELQKAHSNHDDIRTLGIGRYSHWGPGLYFSSSDNKNPIHNERQYSVAIKKSPSPTSIWIIILLIAFFVYLKRRTLKKDSGLQLNQLSRLFSLFPNKKILANIFLIFMGVLAPLVIVEIVFRTIPEPQSINTGIRYKSHDNFYTYEINARFHYKTETGKKIEIITDKNGLRNSSKNAASRRTYVLGDSFISAVNTEEQETLSFLLNTSGLPTYNVGMDGFSTFNAINLLENLITEYNPHLELVVLWFYLGNDFRDNYLVQVPDIDSTHLPKEPPGPIKKIDSTLNKSKIYQRLFKPLVEKHLDKRHSLPKMENYASAELTSLLSEPSQDMKVAIRKTKYALNRLKSLSEKHKFDVFVVGIPSKAQTTQSFKEISGYAIDPDAKTLAENLLKTDFSFDNPDRLMISLTNELNLDYLSLLPTFRSSYKTGRALYGLLDSHWNAVGQKIAAREFLKRIGK